LQATLK